MMFVYVTVSISSHNQSRCRGEPSDNVLQCLERNVGVVQVLKEKHQRLARADAQEGTREDIIYVGAVLHPLRFRNGGLMPARNLIHFCKNRKKRNEIGSQI